MKNLPIQTRKHPLPMQYMGSKLRITGWILDEIEETLGKKEYFIDLMSGTGSVAHQANLRGYKIIANDIQPYSYIVLKSLFAEEKDNINGLVATLKNQTNSDETLLAGRTHASNDLAKEKQFIEDLDMGTFVWQDYRIFCDNTAVQPNQSVKLFDLFSTYYPNTYFGVRQCLELDAIQEMADTLPENLKTHFIAATVSTMTYLVSSTTHLAQYLKPNNEKTAIHLLKRRSMSILEHVVERLERLQEYPTPIDSIITNLDYKNVLSGVHISNGVVYADPPYFKEHYSRYYHVLDTFALYDFPELTYNTRINSVTVGRYRKDRIVSDFGLKSKVSGAFMELFRLSAKTRLDVVLSYAATSLLPSNHIIELAAEHGYSCTLKEKSLLHSGQGQANRNNYVTEYLFIFKYES